MPADIVLDADYMKELRRREALIGEPEATTMTQKEQDESIVKGAEDPMIDLLQRPDKKVIAAIAQSCLDHKKGSTTPK